jgi:hypothetical protein
MQSNKAQTIVRTDKHGNVTLYCDMKAAACANHVATSTMCRYLTGRIKPSGNLSGCRFEREVR